MCNSNNRVNRRKPVDKHALLSYSIGALFLVMMCGSIVYLHQSRPAPCWKFSYTGKCVPEVSMESLKTLYAGVLRK